MIERISIGWVWLDHTLNRIIDQINRQHPIGSTSVAIEESPNGTLFKVAGAPQTDQASSNRGASGALKSKPVVWNGVGWVTVTVVDPTTCAQSTLTVLAQKPNSSITIQA